MHRAIDHPANAGLRAYLEPRHQPPQMPSVVHPSAVARPYDGLGTHPDLVTRLWDELTVQLPADCRMVFLGTPALIHPESGVVFGFAGGTHTYALRLPAAERSAALRAGARRIVHYPSGRGDLDLSTVGEPWVFCRWFADEPAWCLAAYELAAASEASRLRPATNADSVAVREMVYAVLREYGLAPDPLRTDADFDDLESFYRGGLFDVVEDEAGAIVGSVGLRPIDGTTCELRKMYLAREARGRGIGKRLLEHALDRARALGFRRVVLETASVLREAIALYRRRGFTRYSPAHLSERCNEAYALELTDGSEA